MNDLAYRDWMKFQKSFFWYLSSEALVEECVSFFTKARWPDGTPSRSLVLGFVDFDPRAVQPPRIVHADNEWLTLSDLARTLQHVVRSNVKYDFILIDLRSHVKDEDSLSAFLSDYADSVFRALRELLVSKRYCGILVGVEGGGAGFPVPWSIALSCRGHLRLRDEKVGLVAAEGTVYYCLFMQADRDGRPATFLTPASVRLSTFPELIPAWKIPKPPPRKKNEILHPAKFPETLVSDFIGLFTKPGDNVFDPMVGTGSAVIAAIRAGRNGYGVDLGSRFVEIAKQRVESESPPMLFHDMAVHSNALIVQGDATRLEEIDALSGMRFHYCITSPPYWSMLTNRGSENQELRRKKNLPLVYSEDERDLGNVADYDRFLSLLERVYTQVAERLEDPGYLTVIVKNVKRDHIVYPLAWDLVARLCGAGGKYDYLGTTLWCQDDVSVKPFAVGIHWVSNTLHQYCLHFRKRTDS